MFYSQFILAKKGPLGTIWIAAHLERKLRKNQVADTDIGVSVDSILFPEVPIALRLSSHLLLGVVRIYSRKVNYLFDDCSEALLKIKQAFRSTAVDLPPEESTAPYHSITLPETFDLDDFELPDSDIFQGNYVDHHVSTREQITLQDTMDGVVYSTTQFGLDERFGDGDTSGLDLDEELLLNKVAASGPTGVMLTLDSEPHPSAQPMTPFEPGRNDANPEAMEASGSVNQIEGLVGNTDFTGFAQAPCTPGLMEESNLFKTQEASVCDDHLELVEDPNLSNIQETSAYDDHAESDHNAAKFADKENLANITSNSDNHFGNENSVGWCLPNDGNTGTNLNDQEINQLKSKGDLPSTSGHPLVDESFKYTSSASEFPDRNFATLDDDSRLQNLRNVVAGSNEPGHTIDDAFATSVTCQGVRLYENVSSPGFSSEPHAVKDPQECILEINQASLGPDDIHAVENAGNLEKACLPTKPVVLNNEAQGQQDIGDTETVVCHTSKESRIFSVPEQMVVVDTPVIQPCSHLGQSSVVDSERNEMVTPQSPTGFNGLCSTGTSGKKEVPHSPEASTGVQGEVGHATDTMNSVLEENCPTEPIPCEEMQADFNKVNDQVDNVVSNDIRLENVEGSENSELAAPEKLLSVPEVLADQQDNFLVQSTPDKVPLVAGDETDAGINMVSGKKRSFTESTLTVQSLNSEDSLGLVSSKRTKEYIPDDNDLLSSILVGRRSSVLKMKPTPPPLLENTNMNRHRSVPRGYTSKRKVLIDDTMVLHGDLIRQQLTRTEDIRRIRKKAPCTHSEIWIIQKGFLEDEIFSESIFTGLSTGLDLLQGQTYNLSEIRVSTSDPHSAPLEAAEDLNFVVPLGASKDVGYSFEANDNKETGMAGVSECIAFTNGVDGNPVNQHGEENVLQSQGYDIQAQMETINCELLPQSSQHENSRDITDICIDGGFDIVTDAVISTDGLGFDSMPSVNPSLDDKYDVLAGSLASPALLDKENGGDSSTQMDASSAALDQKLDDQSVEKEASLVDTCCERGDDATEAAKENDDHVGVDPVGLRLMDDIFLEETEGGASIKIGADLETSYRSQTDGLIPTVAISSETERLNSQDVRTIDPSMDEIRKNEQGIANEVELHATEFDYDGKNLTSYDCSEELKVSSSYSVKCDVEAKSTSLNNGEYTDCWEADPRCRMDEQIAADHIATEDHDFDYVIDGHDTGFLNADDDEVAEGDEDCMPSAEKTSFIENSGWSARTRAVAKYLQVLFEKEAEYGRSRLPMDNLLAGKTRKEASRMFFEALVLKTRDYIHVEQGAPFDNISIKPGLKLMKSDF